MDVQVDVLFRTCNCVSGSHLQQAALVTFPDDLV